MTYYEVLNPAECAGLEFDILLSLGWYPMEQSIFTTSHLFRDDGSVPPRVHWLRYSVPSVGEKGSHRRIRKKNGIFTAEIVDSFSHDSRLDDLYRKYLDSVDFDGYADIAQATYKRDGRNIYDTRTIMIRDGETLVSCGIFHRGDRSVASILHFFDPAYRRFSPGKYLILKTLDYCREQGIAWYYPGYVIEGNPKMDYKLFLGENSVEYYLPEPDPLHGTWMPFTREILN